MTSQDNWTCYVVSEGVGLFLKLNVSGVLLYIRQVRSLPGRLFEELTGFTHNISPDNDLAKR